MFPLANADPAKQNSTMIYHSAVFNCVIAIYYKLFAVIESLPVLRLLRFSLSARRLPLSSSLP